MVRITSHLFWAFSLGFFWSPLCVSFGNCFIMRIWIWNIHSQIAVRLLFIFFFFLLYPISHLKYHFNRNFTPLQRRISFRTYTHSYCMIAGVEVEKEIVFLSLQLHLLSLAFIAALLYGFCQCLLARLSTIICSKNIQLVVSICVYKYEPLWIFTSF